MNNLESKKEQFQQAENSPQKIDFTSSKLQSYSKFCTNCGSPLEAGDIFCSECGSKIEQDESVVSIEDDKEIAEKKSVDISPDRMASILQTNKIKLGEIPDDFAKPDLSILIDGIEAKEQKAKILGYYVYKNSYMTQYLVIESIQEKIITASVKTTYLKGGYSTEFYTGTLSGKELHLRMIDSDLHPPPSELQFSFNCVKPVHYMIKISEKFDGIVEENEISGSFSGHFSDFVVFRKC